MHSWSSTIQRSRGVRKCYRGHGSREPSSNSFYSGFCLANIFLLPLYMASGVRVIFVCLAFFWWRLNCLLCLHLDEDFILTELVWTGFFLRIKEGEREREKKSISEIPMNMWPGPMRVGYIIGGVPQWFLWKLPSDAWCQGRCGGIKVLWSSALLSP